MRRAIAGAENIISGMAGAALSSRPFYLLTHQACRFNEKDSLC